MGGEQVVDGSSMRVWGGSVGYEALDLSKDHLAFGIHAWQPGLEGDLTLAGRQAGRGAHRVQGTVGAAVLLLCTGWGPHE